MKHLALSLLPLLAIGTACGNKDQEPTDTYESYQSYCIAAGTMVNTPDGTCPVESLEVGSVVLGVDPGTGEVRPTRVMAMRSAERECLQLRLPGGEVLVCTGDHPLYDPDAGEYAPATEWVDGRRSHLSMLVEGRLRRVAVEGHDRYVGVRRVYDLTVEGEPHSFVASGCLVHNKSVFYCDTSYDYNDQGQCVMLSSTGIGDATWGSDTEGDSGTTGATGSSSADGSGTSGSSGSGSGSEDGSATGTGTGTGSGTDGSGSSGSGSGSSSGG